MRREQSRCCLGSKLIGRVRALEQPPAVALPVAAKSLGSVLPVLRLSADTVVAQLVPDPAWLGPVKPEQQPSAAVAVRQPEPEQPREPAVALPVGARLLGFAPPELGLSADSVVAQLAPAPAKPGSRQPGLQPFAAGAVA